MPDLSKRSEKRLIRQLKNGNERAFECIYDQYWQALFNQAYKRLPQPEIVKELIQDLFTELWQKREALDVRSSLSGYLHVALRYKIFNYIKAEIVREKYLDSLLPSSGSRLVEEHIFFHELAAAYEKEIHHLPPQAQRVYVLRHQQSLSYAQIAETLHISVSTVEKHMIKALKIIRENLKEYAVTVGVVLLYY
uniref:Sigma-70 family RNA polymerase sigma factor n=1 Tax=Roseihalotalea indica TaxID=2867963 RepID=A0AA49GQM5_9BACT|nr:sigma-70 family RNA polymerase sigma factor [Tunicatimonas sp. TK19036]